MPEEEAGSSDFYGNEIRKSSDFYTFTACFRRATEHVHVGHLIWNQIVSRLDVSCRLGGDGTSRGFVYERREFRSCLFCCLANKASLVYCILRRPDAYVLPGLLRTHQPLCRKKKEGRKSGGDGEKIAHGEMNNSC